MPRRIASMGSVIAPVLRWLLVAVRVLMKVVVAGVAALVVGLLLAFIVWDVRNFQPQRPQIDKLIAAATEEERNPSEVIVRLVRAASGKGGVAHAAYWVMLRDPVNPTDRPKHLRSSFEWHMRGALWWACVWLHLSEREQITLIVSRSYMGRDMWGFSVASQAIFNRPLSLLSLEEAATLMAIPRCPNRFHTKPEDVKMRRDHLLSKLQAAP